MAIALFAARRSAEDPVARHSTRLKEHEKFMRPNRILSRCDPGIENLRGKWINFTNGMMWAIAMELNHIRCEEMKQQLRSHNQREQFGESLQQ